jgi:hypothetical protein
MSATYRAAPTISDQRMTRADRVETQTVRMTRKLISAVLVGLVVFGTAGCGGGSQDATPGTTPTPTATPSKDPLTGCVEQLVYWANENLRRAPDQAFDYQHMGLTAEKYDELRKIQNAARVLQAKGKLPPTWVHDRSQEACVRILASPAPSNTAGGWPQ